MNGRKIFQDSVTPLPDREGLTPRDYVLNFRQSPGDYR